MSAHHQHQIAMVTQSALSTPAQLSLSTEQYFINNSIPQGSGVLGLIQSCFRFKMGLLGHSECPTPHEVVYAEIFNDSG